MAKLRAPILFSQLSQDIYPIDGDCILSWKAKRKTKLIKCTVEQQGMLVEIPISRKCLVCAWVQIGRDQQFYLAL